MGTMAKGQIVPENQQHGMKDETASRNNGKENWTRVKHDGNNRDAQSICHERVASVQLKSLEDKCAGISAMFGHKQETKKFPRVYKLSELSSCSREDVECQLKFIARLYCFEGCKGLTSDISQDLARCAMLSRVVCQSNSQNMFLMDIPFATLIMALTWL